MYHKQQKTQYLQWLLEPTTCPSNNSHGMYVLIVRNL